MLAEPPDHRIGRADKESVVAQAPIALLEDRVDMGPRLGVGRCDVHVAAQHRQEWPTVRFGRPSVQGELLDERRVGRVLRASQPSPRRPARSTVMSFVPAIQIDVG